jgi:DNA (cytosine-5)-methyltransferase 1
MTERTMEHLDLFSGIGGFALAATWAGIDTQAFCEIDDKAKDVLRKNFPGVQIHDDIKKLDGAAYENIDIITGGYPCQPFSVAGNQAAEKDDRHLWPEMLRIITQAKPSWVICENVHGHVRLGLDKVLHDLEGLSYSVQPFIISALSAGADHRRNRVFIVANASGYGRDESKTPGGDGAANEHPEEGQNKNCNDEGRGRLWARMERLGGEERPRRTKPPEIRVDDGLPGRMDRNKMIGNAVNPLIVLQIFKAIKAEIMRRP